MEEKNKNVKRARTIRFEYNSCVDKIQKWLQEVEVKVQDRIIEASQLKQILIVSLKYNPKRRFLFTSTKHVINFVYFLATSERSRNHVR